MNRAKFLPLLKRLSRARPGTGVLHLPPDLSPEEALQTIRAVLKALEPQVRTPAPAKTRGATRIHIDGGSRGNPGPAGVGVLIIGPDGREVERLHRYIGEATNNVAEYRALLLALERAQALGCTDLEVVSDSELLVRQLQGRYQVKHPTLRPLFAKAQERIASLRRFNVRHVPREENAEADALANRGMDEGPWMGGRSTGVDLAGED